MTIQEFVDELKICGTGKFHIGKPYGCIRSIEESACPICALYYYKYKTLHLNGYAYSIGMGMGLSENDTNTIIYASDTQLPINNLKVENIRKVLEELCQ